MKHDDVQKRFAEAAAGWDSEPRRVALAKAVAESILRHVPLNHTMAVMDYGAGTGLVSLCLHPLVASVVAADTSAEMLKVLEGKIAKHGITNVSTRMLDLTQAAGTQAEFDVIVSSTTLHHVQDTAALFRRFHNILKPDGWLAVADLDAEDGSFHSDPTGVYHHGFERKSIVEMLGQAGFRDAAAHDVHRVAKPDKAGRMREYSFFLAVARR